MSAAREAGADIWCGRDVIAIQKSGDRVTGVTLADGSAVETVESLAGEELLSPLQAAFKRHHALQCGFCTPGILMAADDLLSRERPSRAEIVDMLSGHLCRCTGCAPIIAAIEEARNTLSQGSGAAEE